MQEESSRWTKILEEISGYLMQAQKEEENRAILIKKIISLLEREGRTDSAAWFFLGTMYMPRINAPFPDDYEKAVACFERVERKAGVYWANAMSNIGLFYQREKKEHLKAAAYFSLALQYDGNAKTVKNYYDLSMAHVTKRSYWMEEFKKIENQNQIERMLRMGAENLVLKCPKCAGTQVKNVSIAGRLQKGLTLQNLLGKGEKYKGYCCETCGHEW